MHHPPATGIARKVSGLAGAATTYAMVAACQFGVMWPWWSAACRGYHGNRKRSAQRSRTCGCINRQAASPDVTAASSAVRATYEGAAMRLRLGTLGLLATAGLLAGCSGPAFESQRVFDEAKRDDAYGRRLSPGALQWLHGACHLRARRDDELHVAPMSHARNAMAAARGETPAVAGVTDFGPQPADKVDELTQARDQLVAALGDDGADGRARGGGAGADLLCLLGRAAARELPAAATSPIAATASTRTWRSSTTP